MQGGPELAEHAWGTEAVSDSRCIAFTRIWTVDASHACS